MWPRAPRCIVEGAVSYRFRTSAFLLALVSAAGITVLAAAAPVHVRFEKGKLWLSARAVSAPELFSALAERTGVRFVIDSELNPGALTIDIDGLDLERAVRTLVAAIPQAAGHTMSYAQDGDQAQLIEVTIYGPGKAPAGSAAAVYAATAPATPGPFPTPDLRERMEKMIEAGVPRETAEKVIGLTEEVQKLQATPAPGSYRAEDLSPASREQLQPLLDRGVPMERAVQMLLLQEKYQDTLRELSTLQARKALSGIPSPLPQTESSSAGATEPPHGNEGRGDADDEE